MSVVSGGVTGVASAADDASRLLALAAALDGADAGHTVTIVIDDAEGVVLPSSAVRALMAIAVQLAHDDGHSVLESEPELTTQQAADLLGMSRPHLIKLLERGDLPHHRTSADPRAHRRLRASDVRAYDDERRRDRRASLRELTRLSQDVEGGYR